MRRVCVVTGTRADYGLLYWLLKDLRDDAAIQLHLIATGMHLSPEFGNTVAVIEEDGFAIDARVELLLSNDSPVAIAKSIGLGTIGFADAFERLAPDILVLLGDRFEILAAAQAAMVARIPIAHIHGGESTEGAIDEAIRHAVTKMAHLHFAVAEPYRRRIIQLGEDASRVFNVGAPGLDNIDRLTLLLPEELNLATGLDFSKPTLLVTYHPVTLQKQGSAPAVRELLNGLDHFPGVQLLFTGVNADTEGRIIGDMINDYVAKSGGRARLVLSLGQRGYLSAVKRAAVVVGNSSSGIFEAPPLGTPSVNIGSRQKGRLRDASVIDCEEDAGSIKAAIEKALSPEFQGQGAIKDSHYGGPGASTRIAAQLKTVQLDGILLKTFHDLPAG